MIYRKWPVVSKTIAVICNLVMIIFILGCQGKADPPDPVITIEEVRQSSTNRDIVYTVSLKNATVDEIENLQVYTKIHAGSDMVKQVKMTGDENINSQGVKTYREALDKSQIRSIAGGREVNISISFNGFHVRGRVKNSFSAGHSFFHLNDPLQWKGIQSTREHKESSPSDEKQLLLIDHVPFGLSYEDVQEQFPDIGPVWTEGGLKNRNGLTEAFAATEVLDHVAEINFNFQNDRLYSYYFMVGPVNEDASGSLFEKLKKFYTERFGGCTEERQTENGYTAISSRWKTKGFELGASHIKQANEEYFVSWGFQRSSVGEQNR